MAIQSLTNSSYFTNSKVYLKFGVPKVAISPWGDYVMFGPNRVIEGTVDLTQITAGNSLIVSDVMFFPALAAGQLFIEKTEAVVESATSAGGAISLGLVDSDRATVPTNYNLAFISADTQLASASAGKIVTYSQGATGTTNSLYGSGAAIQAPIAPDLMNSYYITCSVNTTAYTTGKVRFRIFYHALDAAITQ